jgi:hypothetical protein
MLNAPMLDPIGSLIAELRADVDVATIVGMDLAGRVRVRGHEPVGELDQSGGHYLGDARGPGSYQAFVVLSALSEPMNPRLPIFRGLYGVSCYGATHQGARELWGACVKAMHYVGVRTKTNGLGIYISVAEDGGEEDNDPDTHQPLVRGTIRIIATASAVT